MKDEPKGLALLLGEKGDASDEDEEAMPDKASLAGDVMSAMKSGDKASFAEALEAFVGACSDYGEDDD